MPLGIETNNLAPQLIQGNGAALVQGIRQIGQQISGHLTEIQTKRDLASLGQEAQGLNVESNEFPTQLAQLVTRHPLAARDERGQMALSILGKAHGQWQATEAEARAFNRAMAMQTARDRSARTMYDYKTEKGLETPQNIGGALVIPRDPVTQQPNVLLPAPARAGAGPRTLSPGSILVDPTGKELAKNPALPKAPSATAALSKERFNASLLKSQASSLKSEIDSGIRRRDSVEKEQNKILETVQAAKNEWDDASKRRFEELDRTKKAIEAEVNEKKTRHLKLQESLGAIGAKMSEEDDAALLPVPGELPAKQLDRAMAAEFLKQAGGDAQKARALAKEQGFTF